jgi:hypothetical protein
MEAITNITLLGVVNLATLENGRLSLAPFTDFYSPDKVKEDLDRLRQESTAEKI